MKGWLDYSWDGGADEFFVPKEDIAAEALRMWRVFDDEKRKIKPQHKRSPDKAAKYFYQAAIRARSIGVTPEAYVIMAVEALGLIDKLWPQALACQAVDKATKNADAEISQDYLAHYRAMRGLLVGRVSVMPLRYVLADDSAPLSPLFRYAVAKRNGLNDLLPRWQRAAELEYCSHPIVAELFRGVI